MYSWGSSGSGSATFVVRVQTAATDELTLALRAALDVTARVVVFPMLDFALATAPTRLGEMLGGRRELRTVGKFYLYVSEACVDRRRARHFLFTPSADGHIVGAYTGSDLAGVG